MAPWLSPYQVNAIEGMVRDDLKARKMHPWARPARKGALTHTPYSLGADYENDQDEEALGQPGVEPDDDNGVQPTAQRRDANDEDPEGQPGVEPDDDEFGYDAEYEQDYRVDEGGHYEQDYRDDEGGQYEQDYREGFQGYDDEAYYEGFEAAQQYEGFEAAQEYEGYQEYEGFEAAPEYEGYQEYEGYGNFEDRGYGNFRHY